MSRRILDELIRDDARRPVAELSRPRQPPSYVIAFDYQGDGQRFWSGRRPVTDASDAEIYTTFGKANAAIRGATAYLKGVVAEVIEDYGLTSERSVLRVHTEKNPDKRRGEVPA